jgi:enoyl-CoA hydratase/carnithine racemase
MITAAPIAHSTWNGLISLTMTTADPRVAVLTLNDPARRNAMTQAMASDFRLAVARLAEMKPGAVVVTGAGSAFSADGDMEMIRAKQRQGAEQNGAEMFEFYRSFLSILELKVPLVAAINGAAMGAGLCFACACDRRIAADGAENTLGFSFAKLGLTPGMGGTIFPRRLVGEAKAAEMLEKAYNITPRDALAIGMVEMIVPRRQLMDHAMNQAVRLASRHSSILGRRVGYWELTEALKEEARLQGESFLTQQHKRLYEIFIEGLRGRKDSPRR